MYSNIPGNSRLSGYTGTYVTDDLIILLDLGGADVARAGASHLNRKSAILRPRDRRRPLPPLPPRPLYFLSSNLVHLNGWL